MHPTELYCEGSYAVIEGSWISLSNAKVRCDHCGKIVRYYIAGIDEDNDLFVWRVMAHYPSVENIPK